MPKTLTYCPICGHTLGSRAEGGRVRQACDNCGYVHYVNPVPAVGIVIEMDGGLVLIHGNTEEIVRAAVRHPLTMI
ncbi:MAG: hypothetical protein CUN53_08800, partial [Phototrophicales bacterium]